MSFGYGIGTPKNPSESLRWVAGAANQGHQEAQFALGVMLQQGTGGAKNEFAARRWLRQAAAGRDRQVASHAAPIVEQLEKHLLYSGISGEQLLLGLGAALFVSAMAADAMGAEAAFRDDPSHPMNPRNYDAFGSTKQQRDCQFRSVRGGLAVTSGRGAFPAVTRANRGRVSEVRIMTLFDRAGLVMLVGLLAIGGVSIAGAQSKRTVRPRPDDVPQPPASLPGTLAGSYVGQYECNDRWASFNLTIAEPVRGTTAAEAVIPQRYVRVRRGTRANEPTKMQGRVDPASAALTLRTDDEVQLGVKGPEQKLTLQGAIDASNGYLVGTFDYPGCTKFVLVPTTVRGSPSYAATLWVSGQRRERALGEAETKTTAAREARIRSGWISPELRPTGGRLEFRGDKLTYVDDSLGRSPDPFEAIRPIDQINQYLRDSAHKCLATSTVTWKGTEGAATTPHFTVKRYVIECAGSCAGLTYNAPEFAFHAGRSQPYPLVTIQGGLLTERPLPWAFSRPDGSPAPRVRIHTWSGRFGEYGGGCTID